MDVMINIGFTLMALFVTYVIGSIIEKSHFDRLRKREHWSRKMTVITLKTPPSDWKAQRVGLVAGSVVISVDYFKRFLAGLRSIIGGRIKTYEPLLDRARREAIMRMKEEALNKGFNAVLNVRLETSRLASSRKNGKGIAGIEILAFGTGLKRVLPASKQ